MSKTEPRSIESSVAYVKKAFLGAVDQLLAKDLVLLAIDVNEVTICHRLAVYMEPLFSTFSVDCEYNRLEFETKHSSDGSWFRPDIIVHERTVKECNLLVVDAKCTTNKEKIEPSTDSIMMTGDNDFSYTVGVFVVFHTGRFELTDASGPRVSGFWVNSESTEKETFERSVAIPSDMLAMVNKRRR